MILNALFALFHRIR